MSSQVSPDPVYVAALPAPSVRRFVVRYVGYELVGDRPGLHRGLPSPRLTTVVSFGDPVDIARMPGTTRPPGRFTAFTGGLHTGPALIRRTPLQRGVHLDLHPLAVRGLLGVPAAALAGEVVDLHDLLGAPARELVGRLADATSWPARFAALDAVLGRLADRDPRGPVAAEVRRAWDRIERSGGRVPVAALAAEVGWSRRHLGERFTTEVGLPPKVAARIVRLDRSLRLLRHADRPGLAVVAAAAGYTDQPHMTREWRALAGCTPGTWLRDEGVDGPPD